MTNIASIPIKNLVKELTLEVKITGMISYRIRLWIARQLFKIAAKIMACNIRIEEND